jgi:methylated-DNA-protein-cysteine methyltransferase related protein
MRGEGVKTKRVKNLTCDRIYRVISRIPKGRVATYGQIASLAGIPLQARRVGYALSLLSEDSPVPWHRVLNSKGEISQRSDPASEALQRMMLQREGVRFNSAARVSLASFRWEPGVRAVGDR